LKGILKRSRERERVLEDERRRLITEVDGLQEKIRSLEEGKRKAMGRVVDTELDLQLEMNELKQEMKGLYDGGEGREEGGEGEQTGLEGRAKGERLYKGRGEGRRESRLGREVG
jgi:hypothetical protein